jgi:hypothetical protein
MIHTEFRDNLYIALQSKVPLEVLLKSLRSFKERGGKQAEAYSLLEEMREEITDESVEDRLLEVMDFASGFCPIDKRIWK